MPETTETMQAIATLDSDMAFEIASSSGHSLMVDSSEEHGGHDRGMRPVELVLVGLAGCTGMDVISLLRKMRQDVTAYTVEVRGDRAEEHPRVFTTVEVVHRITGHDLNEELIARAVNLSAEKYCPVSAMLQWGAQVTHRFELVTAI